MLSHPSSAQHIHNPQQSAHRPTPYTTRHAQGQQYRVLDREYRCHRIIFHIWAVFWTFVTFALALLIFCKVDQTGPIPILSLLATCTFTQTIFCYFQRKNVSKMMMGCFLACFLFSLSLCIFLACRIQLTIILCSLFSITLIIFVATRSIKKGRIALLLVMLSQMLMIATKADCLTDISWTLVLLPLLTISLFSISSLAFLGIYTLVLKRCYPQSYQQKKYNLLFLMITILGISCLQSVVLGQVYIDLPLALTAAIALCGTSTIAIYLWFYSNELALGFCRHRERVVKGEKDIQVELIPKQTSELSYLYRYSTTWFGKVDRQPQQDTVSSDIPECIICTQESSEVVWLPCGHLSLCTGCSQDVLASNMVRCVLCKQKPQQICKVVLVSREQAKMEKEMGLIVEEKEQNKFQILQLYEVRLGL